MKNLEKYLDCKYILYLDILGMFVFVLEKKQLLKKEYERITKINLNKLIQINEKEKYLNEELGFLKGINIELINNKNLS